MAHGVSEMLSPEASPTTGARQQPQIHHHHHHQQQQQQPSSNNNLRKSVGVMGSRRIFAPAFKLKVLNSYRQDLDCRGNQRATARKYNIHRRQIQKWLQCEDSLRSCCAAASATSPSSGPDSAGSGTSTGSPSPDSTMQQPLQPATLNPSRARLHGDEPQQQQQRPPPPPPPRQPQPQQPSAAVAAAAAAAAAATGYRFLPQQYDYPHPQLIYRAPPPPPVQYHHQYAPGFQPPAVQRCAPASEAAISEIKREPAVSPDSSHHHLHHHHHQHQQQQQQPPQLLKKERLDEEVMYASFSSGISDASSSSSPVPSHLESLPPSPRESSGSSGSDSEADSQHSVGAAAGVAAANGNNAKATATSAADLARRRSFSLRFKLRVLDAFHSDRICKKNQRATARKFNINRRQVQKWLSQERDLRDPTQHRGANRQRLGSHSPAAIGHHHHHHHRHHHHHHEDSNKWMVLPSVERERLPSSHSPPMTTTTTTSTTTLSCEETPVDLRTGGLIEYGHYCGEMSPNSYADSALTPPYSQPGCTLSCCSQEQQPTYYCYSPQHQQQLSSSSQEQPLCLVKPKAEPVSSTVPTPPASTPPKKDAILFKPYLDNPVSKPPPPSPGANNNNSHEICNLNDLALDVSFRPQQHYNQQQQPYYLDIPRARSAFVRYPTYLQ